MSERRDVTMDKMRYHGWTIIKLQPRLKQPVAGVSWITSRDPETVRSWLREGCNIGLVCGPESMVAVADFDDLPAAREMMENLGPLHLTVTTGSGKWHCYLQYEEGLPAKIYWHGVLVGELQRGPRQYVVMPPSVHPSGGKYEWAFGIFFKGELIHEDLEPLPETWRKHLKSEELPDYVARDRRGQPNEDPWFGPPAEELLTRAMQEPGARRRLKGVKFQCPGCRGEGRDRSRDNAIVYNDGRWGCAVDPSHKRDIGEALGVLVDQKLAEKVVTDESVRKVRDMLGEL